MFQSSVRLLCDNFEIGSRDLPDDDLMIARKQTVIEGTSPPVGSGWPPSISTSCKTVWASGSIYRPTFREIVETLDHELFQDLLSETC